MNSMNQNSVNQQKIQSATSQTKLLALTLKRDLSDGEGSLRGSDGCACSVSNQNRSRRDQNQVFTGVRCTSLLSCRKCFVCEVNRCEHMNKSEWNQLKEN